ncbi:MAG: hypothetical protein Q9159_002419 [Coniocarpon cinnabarinum]
MRATRSRTSLSKQVSATRAANGESPKAVKAKKTKEDSDRASPNTSRKRKHVHFKEEEGAEEPLMSGALQADEGPPIKDEPNDTAASRSPKRRSKRAKASPKKSKDTSTMNDADGQKMTDNFKAHRDSQRAENSPTKTARQKNNPYGLSPGVSPFPTFNAPTADDCQDVHDVLAKHHGTVQQPKTIPQPSLNSSGCGEVPSVLDALIRTRLSAATNGANSSRAFRGLVERFGIIKEGVGKGSVDWEAVRTAPVKEVYEAIKTGGLADVKSRHIQEILNMVKEENEADRKLAEADNAKQENDTQAKQARDTEVSKASGGVLSLDHLHTMKDQEAMEHLLRYPGIGPKTASCVLLFCMQRPSFAVDTHVFRLTRWLGWVPSDSQARGMFKRGECKTKVVGRENAYAHMETKVPDDLKYPLHYLLIKHGKECGWCSAKAGKDQKVGTCPLAHLMKGKGRRKGQSPKKRTTDQGSDQDEEASGSEEDQGSEEEKKDED